METRKYKSYVKTDEENILNEVVGQRLKIARTNAKLTQTNLAKKLNISFQQIGKYEKGQNGLNAIRIVQISNLLNIPKSYLLENIELLGEVKQPDDSSVSSHSEFLKV
jgi:transcriptional regulator with XRE-family HTH domain